jgi:hypothetical protein
VYIRNSLVRYIDRTDKGMTKHGSVADGTQSAHKLGWGLMNAVMTHTPGRSHSDDQRAAIARDLNSSDNLRIKTKYGNTKLDERRDARIAEAYVTGESLHGGSTVQRAQQVYQAARDMKSLDSVAEALGNMCIHTGKPGRPPMVKNYRA